MAIKTIDELTPMTTSELTSSDVLIVGTSSGAKKIPAEAAFSGGGASSADEVSYDNTSSGLNATNVQDAIDEVAQGGGGGGSFAPDIYVSCSSDVEPTESDPILYTEPVFGFGDTIDNIVTKLGNGSLVFAGKHKFPGTMGDMYYKMDYESIGVVPKATIEAVAQQMSLDIVPLSDAIVIIPYIIKPNINNDNFSMYQVGSWGDGFIFYTDGKVGSPTYGEIVQLNVNA